MTLTTEELKHAMYHELNQITGEAKFDSFQSALEAYLEELRQDLKAAHIATGDVAIQLSEMTTERDSLRNKLQAFEFANKSAGELLRDVMTLNKQQRESIKRQRQSIGRLKMDRNAAQRLTATRTYQCDEARKELQEARKSLRSTSAQSSEEKAVCLKCGGAGFNLLGFYGFPCVPLTEKCQCKALK
jgi:hypothetical protein